MHVAAAESEALKACDEGVALTQVAGRRMQTSDEVPAWVARAGTNDRGPTPGNGTHDHTCGARAPPRWDEGGDDAFEEFGALGATEMVYAL